MWVKTFIYFCFGYVIFSSASERDFKIVNIDQGPVKGFKDPEHGVYEFKNIPYATAPSGQHKFKAPLPPPTWKETFEGVDRDIICHQAENPYLSFNDLDKQENCLVANVFIPDTDKKNLPVVFYVHGGAFQMGYGAWSTPKKLIEENNIIFVSFNYRLGAHGFLSLGTEDVPGNAGMKDQVAALRWVKKNIASFGGNPEDITLHGSSAGSASVDLLMLSKSTAGLFNKVIPESGANVGVWAIQSDPVQNAKWFASSVNFTDVDDIDALEKFYKNASFEILMRDHFLFHKDSTFVFVPCVERANSRGSEVFLDKSPVDILKSGDFPKVPMLYGFSNMEGLFREFNFDMWKTDMNKNFGDFLPADLKFDSEVQKIEIAEQVKQFYFGTKPIAESNILDYVNYFTDIIFAYPTLRAVKYHVEAGHDKIYLYQYSFVDENTPFVSYTNVKGANHCAQTIAVFYKAFSGLVQAGGKDFEKMSSIVRNIWGSFMRTGVPSTEGLSVSSWPAVGAGWSPHMELGNQSELRGALLEERARFWDSIYAKHYRNPVPPTSTSSSAHHPDL